MSQDNRTSKNSLAEKLRLPAMVFYEYSADNGALLREAADEIDRLTERLAGAYASVNLLTEMLEAKAPQEASGVITAEDLQDAWHKYRDLFGEDPHGTLPQLRALLVGLPKLPHEPKPSEATGPFTGETASQKRDRDWILAIAAALGTDSGFNVPIVPEVEPFRDLFAAVRARPVEPAEATGIYESAWVIEGMWSSAAYPEYWVGSSAWSSDPYKALRFASKESAQQAADMMLVGINHRVACHEFAGNSHHE